MAVYTRVDDANLTPFLARYGLPPATMFKGIAEGVENSNYLLESGGTRYILTLYEKRVAADDLPYFLQLMDHVTDKGVAAARPIRDQDGTILQELCGRPAALIEFLDGVSADTPTALHAQTAGEALASFHLATEDFPMDRPNALGPAAWVAMGQDLASRLDTIADGLAASVAEAATRLKTSWPDDLPRGTCHADLFPDNALFKGDTLSGMIDFYFACTDAYAYDVAISLNAWTPEPDGTVPIEADNAQAFLMGYNAVRPLSAAENEALPLFLEGAALRFLLTRAHDFLHQVPGSLVRVKDPLPYWRLMQHHRTSPKAFLER